MIPGEVPLRRVFRVVNGGTPTAAAENWDGDVPWATPVDLARFDGGVLTTTSRSLTRVGLETGSATVPAGSLILSTRAPIGYVVQTVFPVAFNQGCRGLVPLRPVDARYFRYQLVGNADRLRALGQGSTFVELSSESLANTPLAVPDITEQRFIADYLDAETARIDALIEKKRRMVTLLAERRMAVMIAGVSGVYTSAGRTQASLPWLVGRGRSWSEVKLTLVARLGSGHTPSREHPEWWVDSEIPWITTGEVAQMRSDRIEEIVETRERISEAGLANSAAELHPAGTVVLCRTASAGYSAIMGTDMATSQDFATWTCGSRLRPRYLLLCLRAMRQDLLGRLAMGSTHQTIYMPDIESIRVPLPPPAEQDAIVEQVWSRLNPLDRARDEITRQLELLVERRQALITAAVTGQLDTPGLAA